MKKSTLIIFICLAVIGLLCVWGVNLYNAMVTGEENIENAWGKVQSQYQRRADLIPNLVATVKGYAAHESETLEAVMQARAKATSVTISADNMTEAQMRSFQEAQANLTNALGRLIAVSEAYPDLKANTNFLELQSQLEGTENRITVARNAFNDAVKDYNTFIRRFPRNIIAGMFGFEKKPYFEAENGAEKAPKVEF